MTNPAYAHMQLPKPLYGESVKIGLTNDFGALAQARRDGMDAMIVSNMLTKTWFMALHLCGTHSILDTLFGTAIQRFFDKRLGMAISKHCIEEADTYLNTGAGSPIIHCDTLVKRNFRGVITMNPTTHVYTKKVCYGDGKQAHAFATGPDSFAPLNGAMKTPSISPHFSVPDGAMLVMFDVHKGYTIAHSAPPIPANTIARRRTLVQGCLPA